MQINNRAENTIRGVAQPGERADAVQLAGLDQAVDGGGTLSAGIRTGEEPIFPAEGDAPSNLAARAAQAQAV